MNKMQDFRKKTIKVALPGMDGRTHKTLALYLQGPCKSSGAIVVDDMAAEVEIIDIDLPGGKAYLHKKLETESAIPSIVLSLADVAADRTGTTQYLKKPITQQAMLDALEIAKRLVLDKKHQSKIPVSHGSIVLGGPATTSDAHVELGDASSPVQTPPAAQEAEPAPLKHYVADTSDKNKTSKHKTAMQLDEKSFAAYMGIMTSLDAGNPAQLKEACYNPKDYFQGYVQSAYKIATARGQVLELISGWKQLLIFPHSNEIWLDADDKQLRAFAGIAINSHTTVNKNMSVTALNPKTVLNRDLEKFQSMDALLWKLACWTSRGRYPESMDIEAPVYLKHWPNFTRLLITPHAMRIAALLVENPRTPTNIAEILKIKPEYVFIFISAAHAIGLLNQATRNSDTVVAPPPEIKPDKKHSLFSRILSKLRANKE